MKLQNLWWLLLLRGIFLLFFGFAAVGWPGMTFLALTYIFALYILVSGVLNVIHGVTGLEYHRYWFLTLGLGILEIGVGVFALGHPVINAQTLILIIGFTFIVRGVLETVVAFDERFSGSTRIILIIAGLLSVLAGLVILRYPVSGTLAFIWVLGVYALIVGSMSIALSISFKVLEDEVTRPVRAHRTARA